MMDKTELRKLVNTTGFAFQTAVEELVASSGSPFSVVATEHAWVHPNSKRSGFADIILESGWLRLIIECKRRSGGQWIFLRPEARLPESTSTSRRVEVLWTAVSSNQEASATNGIFCTPDTSQCPFCVVRGSGEDQQPMLERIAGHLLEATEAIAHEQRQIDLAHRATGPNRIWFYIPVIVTNAELSVCSFKPSDVNATDGLLPPTARFESATVVRFFKNLAFDFDPAVNRELSATNRAKNRTVFVVNTAGFQTFLRQLHEVEGMPSALRPFLGLG
jgi:hypothetical protein